jgi:hypothetical protein
MAKKGRNKARPVNKPAKTVVNRRYDLLKEMNKEKDRSSKEWARRPLWRPAIVSKEPLPDLACSLCGLPIQSLGEAILDKDRPAHFDCVIEKIKKTVKTGPGERVAYIGGGRFGLLHYENPENPASFSIRKIFEWEDKEEPVSWRGLMAEKFSST